MIRTCVFADAPGSLDVDAKKLRVILSLLKFLIQVRGSSCTSCSVLIIIFLGLKYITMAHAMPINCLLVDRTVCKPSAVSGHKEKHAF